MSAPHFTLSRVFPGVPSSRRDSNGIDLKDYAWLHIAKCRYVFLLFEKTV
jgi:hypothetical protein